jgi:hypothetical protein
LPTFERILFSAAVMSIEGAGRPEVASAKRIGSTFVEFLKEWGGLATLCIALLYTFSFDAWELDLHLLAIEVRGGALQNCRATDGCCGS